MSLISIGELYQLPVQDAEALVNRMIIIERLHDRPSNVIERAQRNSSRSERNNYDETSDPATKVS